ncbi:hypothetical protein CBOM_02182 [Ceraceosorus bombacis]|uniref:Uncharacterized protein n=1 Tax=Ceraceosorus bombacis TaxID=401625 RepID=A0A0P1BFB4_9BASI|nr:hypothetical protein CBOM_02182 [Ceraceosorus bombacis]
MSNVAAQTHTSWALLPCRILEDTFEISVNEVASHHSWASDHLDTAFSLLHQRPFGLRNFAIRRIVPSEALVAVASDQGLGAPMVMEASSPGSLVRSCHPMVLPRALPTGAMTSLITHGASLQKLELDFFILSIGELQALLHACHSLELLKVLVDAPMERLLSVSSAFVPLTRLHTFAFTLALPHCFSTKGFAPSAGYQQASNGGPGCAGNTNPSLPRFVSQSSWSREGASPDLGGAFECPSGPGDQEAAHTGTGRGSSVPMSPSSGRLPQPLPPLAADLLLPPKRDIRKFARRCQSLKVMRWTGRHGKGEWRISGTSAQNIDFFPAGYLSIPTGRLEDTMLERAAEAKDHIAAESASAHVLEDLCGGLLALSVDGQHVEDFNGDRVHHNLAPEQQPLAPKALRAPRSSPAKSRSSATPSDAAPRPPAATTKARSNTLAIAIPNQKMTSTPAASLIRPSGSLNADLVKAAVSAQHVGRSPHSASSSSSPTRTWSAVAAAAPPKTPSASPVVQKAVALPAGSAGAQLPERPFTPVGRSRPVQPTGLPRAVLEHLPRMRPNAVATSNDGSAHARRASARDPSVERVERRKKSLKEELDAASMAKAPTGRIRKTKGLKRPNQRGAASGANSQNRTK